MLLPAEEGRKAGIVCWRETDTDVGEQGMSAKPSSGEGLLGNKMSKLCQ